MPAGEDVSVSGMVQTGDGAPIHMIKVTIYREDREVAHAFTEEGGKYVMSVAKGKPITVRFDTHFSLNNAKDWHPSVVANVSAMKDVAVDRVLLRVGHGDGFTAFIDALSGYEFGAFCEDRGPQSGLCPVCSGASGTNEASHQYPAGVPKKACRAFSRTGPRAVRGVERCSERAVRITLGSLSSPP